MGLLSGEFRLMCKISSCPGTLIFKASYRVSLGAIYLELDLIILKVKMTI